MKSFPIVSELALMPSLKDWAHKRRNRSLVSVDFRQNDEVRLVPNTKSTPVNRYQGDYGCTLYVQSSFLRIACSDECDWIEKSVSQFLFKKRIISYGVEEVECPKVPRRIPQLVNKKGSATSAPNPYREKKKLKNNAFKNFKYASVIEAVKAASRDAGAYLIITERALNSAAESNFHDPDYVYKALMDLSLAAQENAKSSGLGKSWKTFLGARGSHDYCSHSSTSTLQRFSKEYSVSHDGNNYNIESHIRKGRGADSEAIRIYLSQPNKKGDPVVIGHVGSHLSTDMKSH
jgi:hypothetical protein